MLHFRPFLYCLALCFMMASCHQQSPHYKQSLPSPTLGKDLAEDDGPQKREFDVWYESIHKAAPDVDWRAIEKGNQIKLYHKRKALDKSQKAAMENLANGNLIGEWIERGPNNQAGSIRAVDYHPISNELYALSDGGTLWKSPLDGSDWQVLNDDLVFNGFMLRVVDKPTANQHIVASIGKDLWYSTDNGDSWTQSSGLSYYDDWGVPRRLIRLQNGDLYYLVETWLASPWGRAYQLYYSNDSGESFSLVKSISYVDFHGVDIWSPVNSNELYLLERNAKIHTVTNGTASLLNNISGLGNGARFHFSGYQASSGAPPVFYALVDKNDLYKSIDMGANWTFQGTTSKEAWDVGLMADPFIPNQLYFGEVEFVKSLNDGANWSIQNNWWDYYSLGLDYIHADIMSIDAFVKSDGTPFVLVSDHGGLHITYDGFQSTEFISFENLNNTQHYFCRTNSSDPAIIIGGTQDKGLIRTTESNPNAQTGFAHVITGDYLQMEFCNYEQSYWAEYPDGDMSFFSRTNGGLIQASYVLEGNDFQLWSVPTAPTAVQNDHAILLGGGRLGGGSGSYLIKLDAVPDGSGEHTLNSSQFNYNFKSNSLTGNANISAIATTPLDTDRYYVATSDGTFFYSNGGNFWNNTSSFSGPSNQYLFGACIAVSPLNPDVIYYGGSGYSNPAVYQSTDGGQSFDPIDNGMPNTFVYKMAVNEDESLVFAATESGPYVYVAADNMWYDMMGMGAPQQTYTDVQYLPQIQTVRFSTYGRGVWDFRLGDVMFANTCNFTVDLNLITQDTCAGATQTIVATLNGLNPNDAIFNWSNSLGNNDTVDVVLNSSSTYTLSVIDANTGCLVKEDITVRASTEGACKEYCFATAQDGTGADYINYVSLNTLSNNSGKEGYADFTNLSTQLNLGEDYTLEVGLNYAFTADTVFAWIDYDHNLEFESQELIVMSDFDNNDISSATFTVPSTATPGTTRLRVRNIYGGLNAVADPCEAYFGEVEDYTVELVGGVEAVLEAKVFLEACYDVNTGEMKTDLYQENLLPLNQPYDIAPWNHSEAVSVPNAAAFPTNTVDWVLVELRQGMPILSGPLPASTLAESHAALLLSDGSIVSSDGTPLKFNNVELGQNYYLLIRHRNHLDIVSGNALAGADNMIYDFTLGLEQSFGVSQQKLSTDGKAMMFAADFNIDASIQISDYNRWKAIPAVLDTYSLEDANMDGVIQTTDYDVWYENRSVNGITEVRL